MPAARFRCRRIDPVPPGVARPFWSVMIPTFNRVRYLERAVRSVLDQDPGPEHMQIQVVDDHSTAADVEALVHAIGKGRVEFYRQPQNRGLVPNFNACLARSRGRWVHLLHEDDFVLPGFYGTLRHGVQAEPAVGAAFCRWNVISGQGTETYCQQPLRPEAGIMADFVEHIFNENVVQMVAMVVCRAVYEKHGGFSPDFGYVVDWEMWARIGARGLGVWYEPQVLATYRRHVQSATIRLMRSGADTAAEWKLTEFLAGRLPVGPAD